LGLGRLTVSTAGAIRHVSVCGTATGRHGRHERCDERRRFRCGAPASVRVELGDDAMIRIAPIVGTLLAFAVIGAIAMTQFPPAPNAPALQEKSE
jgi:hypothetical protein